MILFPLESRIYDFKEQIKKRKKHKYQKIYSLFSFPIQQIIYFQLNERIKTIILKKEYLKLLTNYHSLIQLDFNTNNKYNYNHNVNLNVNINQVVNEQILFRNSWKTILKYTSSINLLLSRINYTEDIKMIQLDNSFKNNLISSSLLIKYIEIKSLLNFNQKKNNTNIKKKLIKVINCPNTSIDKDHWLLWLTAQKKTFQLNSSFNKVSFFNLLIYQPNDESYNFELFPYFSQFTIHPSISVFLKSQFYQKQYFEQLNIWKSLNHEFQQINQIENENYPLVNWITLFLEKTQYTSKDHYINKKYNLYELELEVENNIKCDIKCNFKSNETKTNLSSIIKSNLFYFSLLISKIQTKFTILQSLLGNSIFSNTLSESTNCGILNRLLLIPNCLIYLPNHQNNIQNNFINLRGFIINEHFKIISIPMINQLQIFENYNIIKSINETTISLFIKSNDDRNDFFHPQISSIDYFTIKFLSPILRSPILKSPTLISNLNEIEQKKENEEVQEKQQEIQDKKSIINSSSSQIIISQEENKLENVNDIQNNNDNNEQQQQQQAFQLLQNNYSKINPQEEKEDENINVLIDTYFQYQGLSSTLSTKITPLETRSFSFKENIYKLNNLSKKSELIQNSLPQFQKTNQMEGLDILISEDLLVSNPFYATLLLQKYKIRCIDAPLEYPISFIIDEVTGICILSSTILQLQSKDYLKQYIKKLTSLVFKFNILWLLIIHENDNQNHHNFIQTSNEIYGMLYQSLTQFPCLIEVRFTSNLTLPSIIYQICEESSEWSTTNKDILLSTFKDRKVFNNLSSYIFSAHCKFCYSYSFLF